MKVTLENFIFALCPLSSSWLQRLWRQPASPVPGRPAPPGAAWCPRLCDVILLDRAGVRFSWETPQPRSPSRLTPQKPPLRLSSCCCFASSNEWSDGAQTALRDHRLSPGCAVPPRAAQPSPAPLPAAHRPPPAFDAGSHSSGASAGRSAVSPQGSPRGRAPLPSAGSAVLFLYIPNSLPACVIGRDCYFSNNSLVLLC